MRGGAPGMEMSRMRSPGFTSPISARSPVVRMR
jgi:hypothetical protein